MKRTLYVTDLDGTLMRDDKSISKTTIEIFNNLIKRGVLITYATARSINSASLITKDINFKLPVIVRNGTVFADQQTKKEIEIVKFNKAELQSIKKCLKEIRTPGFVTAYIDGIEKKTYLNEITNEGFKQYLEAHINDTRLRAVNSEDRLYDGEVCYFTFIAEKEKLEPLYECIKACDQCVCVFQRDKYRPEYWLEISPKEATKAKAIQRLQRQYSCERLVVFGDSLNDISMFQIADEAYAVENASDCLKSIATGIIDNNNFDSVAKWLDENT